MLSLFEFLTIKRKFRQILRRVSPPLVGAVLLCLPLPVLASSTDQVQQNLGLINPYEGLNYYFFAPSNVATDTYTSPIYGDHPVYIRADYSDRVLSIPVQVISNMDTVIDKSVRLSGTVTLKMTFIFENIDWLISNFFISDCTYIDVYGNTYSVAFDDPVISPQQDPGSGVDSTHGSTRYHFTVTMVLRPNCTVSTNGGQTSKNPKPAGNFVIHYSFNASCRGKLGETLPSLAIFDFSMSTYLFRFRDNMIYSGSIFEDDVVGGLKEIQDQQQQFRDEDISEANKTGTDIQGFASNLEATIKGKWSILWYPIEFTNSILDVFTGGTSSAAYIDSYGSVLGYTYDEDVGFIVPVTSSSRSVDDVVDVPSGTVLHFPSYTLPVLDVELWEGFGYDLADLPDQFPFLFNSLYVVETILMFWWLVGFLRDKYDEVFG